MDGWLANGSLSLSLSFLVPFSYVCGITWCRPLQNPKNIQGCCAATHFTLITLTPFSFLVGLTFSTIFGSMAFSLFLAKSTQLLLQSRVHTDTQSLLLPHAIVIVKELNGWMDDEVNQATKHGWLGGLNTTTTTASSSSSKTFCKTWI